MSMCVHELAFGIVVCFGSEGSLTRSWNLAAGHGPGQDANMNVPSLGPEGHWQVFS